MRNSYDTFLEAFDHVTHRPLDKANITIVGTEPLTDENGEVVFLTPGSLSLGMICVLCMGNFMDTQRDDETSKELSDRISAEFHAHMEDVHGAMYDDE